MGRQVGNYLILEAIGSGSYAKVYRGQDRLTGEFVAIKVVHNSKITSARLAEYLEQEIRILESIKHPNIVNLKSQIKTSDKTFLIMEYCRGGDFDKYLKRKKRLTEDEARFFLQQLAAALELMREKRVIHRDLKPSNILLATDDDRPTLKVADFGYARYIDPQDLAETHLGTPLYMAPEVFAPPHQYDSKADLWSVGCILYEMLVGRVPFIAQSQLALFQLIDTQPVTFPKDVVLSDACKDLLLKLLKKNRVERITFEEFFMHPFLRYAEYRTSTLPALADSQLRASGGADDQFTRIVAEAMNSLIGEHSPPQGTPPGDPEPSFAAAAATAASPSSSSGRLFSVSPTGGASKSDAVGPSSSGSSGSLTRLPKTNPYKTITADSEDGYIMVNPAAVEVNVIADVLNRSPVAPLGLRQQLQFQQQALPPTPSTATATPTGAFKQPSPTSVFTRSILSSSPPQGIGIGIGIKNNSPPYPSPSPSSSPTVGSALSRALAAIASRSMWPTSSTTPEEKNARDILQSLETLSSSASSDDERAIWGQITTSARRAYAVVDLAATKLASRQSHESEDDSNYNGYILYLKALSLIRVAMIHAKRFWQLKDQTITPNINQVVQFLRDCFNEYLDHADRLNLKLKGTKYRDVLSTNRVSVDQARLLFERARELGKEGGIEEFSHLAISERFYANALLFFETLLSRDLPESEILNDNDRRIVEGYASSTLRRMQQIQKKLPPAATSNSPPN